MGKSGEKWGKVRESGKKMGERCVGKVGERWEKW